MLRHGRAKFTQRLICHRLNLNIMMTAESEEPLKISANPGTTIPLLAGAVGKVFMALKDSDQLKKYLHEYGLPEYTPNSITDEEAYHAEIEQVRKQGYAVDDEEYITGIRAVTVALQNQRGPSMAVWVVGMTGTMESKKITRVIDVTTCAAESLRAAVEDFSKRSK